MSLEGTSWKGFPVMREQGAWWATWREGASSRPAAGQLGDFGQLTEPFCSFVSPF